MAVYIQGSVPSKVEYNSDRPQSPDGIISSQHKLHNFEKVLVFLNLFLSTGNDLWRTVDYYSATIHPTVSNFGTNRSKEPSNLEIANPSNLTEKPIWEKTDIQTALLYTIRYMYKINKKSSQQILSVLYIEKD